MNLLELSTHPLKLEPPYLNLGPSEPISDLCVKFKLSVVRHKWIDYLLCFAKFILILLNRSPGQLPC